MLYFGYIFAILLRLSVSLYARFISLLRIVLAITIKFFSKAGSTTSFLRFYLMSKCINDEQFCLSKVFIHERSHCIKFRGEKTCLPQKKRLRNHSLKWGYSLILFFSSSSSSFIFFTLFFFYLFFSYFS